MHGIQVRLCIIDQSYRIYYVVAAYIIQIMKRKKLIWLIGGMASGKSTVRRALCKVLAESDPVLIEQEGIEYTDFGNIGCVGKCLKEDGCDGLDSSFGRLKKSGGLATTNVCIDKYELTILEGSQTSSEWIKELHDICEKRNCDFYVVLLDCRYWENYLRLKKRIESRGGTEADITDSRIGSVTGKINQFRHVFDKASEYAKCIRIDTEGLSIEEEVLQVLTATEII